MEKKKLNLSEPDIIHRSVFTDIDTLLDTRLSLAYELDSEGMVDMIKGTQKDRYRTRLIDNFGNISSDIFYQIYNRRKKVLLYNAIITRIPGLISEQFTELYEKDPSVFALEEPPKLIINLFPYNLTIEEQSNLLEYFYKLIEYAPIEFVYLPLNKITPTFLKKQKIETIVMYEAIKWLEVISAEEDLIANNILNIHCIAPAIVEPRTDKEKISKEIFDVQAQLLATILELHYVEADYFSAVDIYLENEKEE